MMGRVRYGRGRQRLAYARALGYIVLSRARERAAELDLMKCNGFALTVLRILMG